MLQAGLLARPDQRVTLAPLAGTRLEFETTGDQLRNGVTVNVQSGIGIVFAASWLAAGAAAFLTRSRISKSLLRHDDHTG